MPLHRVDMRESLTHLFKQRSFVGKLHLLWKIADGCLGRDGDLPRRRTLQSGNDFQHCRFPGAILAHKGNPVARINHIIYIVEKRHGAEFHSEVLNSNHSDNEIGF